MKGKKLALSTTQEIARLKGLNYSKTAVAKSLRLNRETVIKYWDGPKENQSLPPTWIEKIDWDYIKKEVGNGVPRKILYEEQKISAPLPSYQAFCQYLRNHGNIKQPDVVIRQHREPGKTVEVDYSGDSKDLVNISTGDIQNTELFASTLGFSSHVYAEFTPSQQMEDFIMAHVRMFEWYDGVPLSVIPDNCKTAVTKTHKFDPYINPTYLDMCKHYNITVDPADPASPTHKSNVERAIQYIQTDFLARIRDKKFSSLMALNKELKIWLKEINDKPIQGRGKSRNYFLEKEHQYFRSLPQSRYEIYYFKKAKVHPDCHFQHNKNYYSVPYKFAGKEIDVRFNSRMVHAYINCEKIASHPVCKGTHHHSTNTDHYPEKKYVDTNYHLEQAKYKSKSIGKNASVLIERLIREAKHPLKILRKVQGIMGLQRKFSKEALDYGCEQGLIFNRMNYDHIKRFAEHFKNQDQYRVSKDTPKRQEQYSFLQEKSNDTND